MVMKIYISIVIVYATFFIAILFRMLFLYFKLLGYLYEHHRNKWNELTTVFNMGPGIWNSLSIFDFVFNKEGLNDPKVPV